MNLTQSDVGLLQLCSTAERTNANFLTDTDRHRAIELYRSFIQHQISRPSIAHPVDEVVIQIRHLCLALSPQKRLPPEILARIFVISAEAEAIKYPADLSQIQWIVGRVCSWWRGIACAEPCLWNRVHVDNRDLPDSKLAHPIIFLRSILPASGLLSITIYLSRKAKTATLKPLILPYMSRLKKFHLSYPVQALWELADLPPEFFKTVEDMALLCSHGFHREVDTRYILEELKLFKHAVNLRRLKFKNPQFQNGNPMKLQSLSIPMGQLHELDLSRTSGIDIEEMMYILRKCVSLQCFSTPFFSHNQRFPASDSLVLPALSLLIINDVAIFDLQLRWSQLTSLRVSFLPLHARMNLGRFLAVLGETPNLEILILSKRFDYGYVPLPDMVTMAKLHTICMDIEDSCILAHITVPQLRELRISQVSPPEYFLNIFHTSYAVLDNSLHDLVKRSRCALRILDFQSVTQSIHSRAAESIFRHLLPTIPSIREFYVRYMLFDKELLDKVGRGDLLPNLRDLHARLEDPFDLVLAIERQQERGGLLRSTRGYLDSQWSNKTRRDALKVAQDRLTELNITIGSDFRIIVD